MIRKLVSQGIMFRNTSKFGFSTVPSWATVDPYTLSDKDPYRM